MFAHTILQHIKQINTSYLQPEHQTRIIKNVNNITTVITAFCGTITLFTAYNKTDGKIITVISFFILLSCLSSRILLSNQRPKAAAALLSTALYVSITISLIPYGFSRTSIITLGLAIPLVLLGQILGRPGVILALLCAFLCIAIVVLSVAYGIGGWAIPEGPPIAPIAAAISILTIIGIILASTHQEIISLTASLRESNVQLQRALQEIERQVIEEERRSMALELHDGIGHHLHALRLHAAVLQQALERQGRLDRDSAEALEVILETSHNAQAEITHMADLAYDQPTPAGEKPLEELLAQPARTCQLGGVSTRLEVLGQPAPLGTLERHMLYRVAQEAATNIGRHARASQASFALDYRDPQRLLLIIQDNGVGLPPDQPRGRGLRNIRERVALLGGQLELHSGPDQGVRLWISIPRSATSSPTTTPCSARACSACSNPTLT